MWAINRVLNNFQKVKEVVFTKGKKYYLKRDNITKKCCAYNKIVKQQLCANHDDASAFVTLLFQADGFLAIHTSSG